MNSEQIYEAFDGAEDEFLEFERIPMGERLHKRPDLCGMLYLDRLFPDIDPKSDMVTHSEHDEIFLLSLDYETDYPQFKQEDAVYLYRCGVRFHDARFCMFT